MDLISASTDRMFMAQQRDLSVCAALYCARCKYSNLYLTCHPLYSEVGHLETTVALKRRLHAKLRAKTYGPHMKTLSDVLYAMACWHSMCDKRARIEIYICFRFVIISSYFKLIDLSKTHN